MPKTLLCTGFHRSATSVTAHYLHNAGLNMGYELMRGNVSNPNGHYEDWPAVRLHDEQLEQNNTSWQFHDEHSLKPSTHFLDSYVKSRSEKSNDWGVKDPRACLFLNEWQRSLGSRGYYLFVARHWSSCIESLLHRHSRDFAHFTPSATDKNPILNFWQTPALAARMWLSYNQRILDFARTHKAVSLVATQRALFNHVPLIHTLNERFGFNLDASIRPPFNPHLLREEAASTVSYALSSSLKIELNSMWEQLLSLADFKSEDEAPKFYSLLEPPEAFLSQLHNAQNQLRNTRERFTKTPISTSYSELPQAPDEDVVLRYLINLDSSAIDHNKYLKIKAYIDKHLPTVSSVWLEFAKLIQRAALFEQALHAFQYTITLGEYYPYISMHMAQCYENLGMLELAHHFYSKAASENQNNPIFYVAKSRFLNSNQRQSEAIECLSAGITKLGYIPQLVTPLATIYLESNLDLEAENILNQFQGEPDHLISNLRVSVELKKNINAGTTLYKEFIKKQLDESTAFPWLASYTEKFDMSVSEVDFVSRCYGHWQQLRD